MGHLKKSAMGHLLKSMTRHHLVNGCPPAESWRLSGCDAPTILKPYWVDKDLYTPGQHVESGGVCYSVTHIAGTIINLAPTVVDGCAACVGDAWQLKRCVDDSLVSMYVPVSAYSPGDVVVINGGCFIVSDIPGAAPGIFPDIVTDCDDVDNCEPCLGCTGAGEGLPGSGVCQCFSDTYIATFSGFTNNSTGHSGGAWDHYYCPSGAITLKRSAGDGTACIWYSDNDKYGRPSTDPAWEGPQVVLQCGSGPGAPTDPFWILDVDLVGCTMDGGGSGGVSSFTAYRPAGANVNPTGGFDMSSFLASLPGGYIDGCCSNPTSWTVSVD